MIGVIANPSDQAVTREFFELFKTPWEFVCARRRYDVLLCVGDTVVPESTAKLVLIYAGCPLPFDAESGIEFQPSKASILSCKGIRIPVYGDSITFRHSPGVLVDEKPCESAMCCLRSPERTVIRIGYNLFGEVRTLLTAGQPVIHAAIPALDLHITLLRDLIIAAGIPLVEIPPVPHGYRFVACLTHDVDHPLLREHKFDHTMLGFLYRALLGSIAGAFRRRMCVRDLLSNWVAVLKLPFVYLGLSKDFWNDFGRRYLHIEKRFRSSFFVIPFKTRPGRTVEGPAPRARGARYGAEDIAAQIRELQAAGCEIGLHGIDAWLDPSKGHEELREIRRIAGGRDLGVRMHWLYFDERSAAALDAAGADYDSTSGYNETVGYRAGTAQVFKPLEAAHLLELPLHVMDTALFFPSHLDLSPDEAAKRVGTIIDHAVQSGGCVTVNWHDRSIAPERLWGDFYVHLLADLESRGAWFATATQAVSWFRRRRSAVFEAESLKSGSVRVRTMAETGEDLPDLQLRAHNGQASQQTLPLAALTSDRDTSMVLSPRAAPTIHINQLTYVLITPARNEEAFIEQTIRSVVSQTVRPRRWVIVSDGSTDRTDEIVKTYLREHPWIELVRMPERRDRHFGAKVHCFNAGYEKLRDTDFDIIGNLDADITFGEDHFEFLLAKFAADSGLGVAGTPFVEGNASYDFRFTAMDHVSGACQLFRRDCYQQIGGYVPVKGGGIDWIAVTTARMRGWQTRTFVERVCQHHRPMGTASVGKLRASARLGRQDYYLGGHPLWQLFRACYQMGRTPYVVCGLLLFAGYFWAWIHGVERPVSRELIRFHQHEQMQRLFRGISRAFRIGAVRQARS